jgi:hypothetical protein
VTKELGNWPYVQANAMLHMQAERCILPPATSRWSAVTGVSMSELMHIKYDRGEVSTGRCELPRLM